MATDTQGRPHDDERDDQRDDTGLLVRVEDGVLWLTMNRPAALNAVTAAMGVALLTELEGVAARDDVRVVVLTGAGDAFSAGADIGGEDAHERFDVSNMDATSRMVRAILACDRPVVAAVNGVAAGVAAGLALACDLVVAAESASFLLPFTRIGLMPDGGTSATVAASIGRMRAMRMGLLADPLTATEAYAAGLVSHLAPDAELPDLVVNVVRRLAVGPPRALTATKRAVNAAAYAELDPALERERTSQALLMRTADVAEGMRAFSERRRPTFRGE